MKLGKRTIIPLALLLLLVILGLAYTGWTLSAPERTCASCHEIVPSLEIWQTSAHREVECSGCHGTAVSNGFHSLKERTGMVFSHLGKRKKSHEIRLDEETVLEVMDACVECHRDEQTGWLAGGHSATYADIFLDEAHNSRERPYPGCLRCHGMYYEGTISDLVQPLSTTGPWSLKDPKKASQPVIPCLACHPVHTENDVRGRPASLDEPEAIFYEREGRNPLTGLYMRSEKMSLRADLLRRPDMVKEGMEVLVSDDPVQRICMQCHAPNWQHEAGSEDDRTPTGVHEGISCRACHRGHSNDARDACRTCHPAVTSCNRDVQTMNTTYRNRESPHDIHSMKCTDCHDPVPAG